MAAGQPNFVLRHLFIWLHALNRTVEAAVAERRRENAGLARHAGNMAELNAQHAGQLLQGLRKFIAEGPPRAAPLVLQADEQQMVTELVERHGRLLPLHRLATEAGLSAFELAALVIVAAPVVDPAYGRLYGYVLDDLAQRAATIGLVQRLAIGEGTGLASARRMLGPGGRLRRMGLVVASEPLSDDPAVRLSPAPGLVDWLMAACRVPPVALEDPQILVPDSADLAACQGDLAAAAQALRNASSLLVTLWGGDSALHEDMALALAAGARLRICRGQLPLGDDWRERLAQDLAIAVGADALLWIDCTGLADLPLDRREHFARVLAERPLRLLLSAPEPWRALPLLASRPVFELSGELLNGHVGGWSRDLAGIDPQAAERLSEGFRFGRSQRRAAINLASTILSPEALSQGGLESELRRACGLVAAPAGGRAALVVRPRRTLDDLILPPAVHRQIADIARLYASASKVDRDWGFGRIAGSSGAIKVLFTGDPGTGKTLAAEAIAAATGMHLLKVDLSQVVSKWIGETEKNLEEVFRHAEQCRSVLFFDEADALFGKRGEVRHGTDRYANMEVSYLLQRLEVFGSGVVVLSSNLRDEIDPAFTRRFQVAINFPRPQQDERRKIWNLALAGVPHADSIRTEALSEIELTGGGIVTAARMAALLAAAEGADGIEEAHLAEAIGRQFNKEARLLTGTARSDSLSIARGLR